MKPKKLKSQRKVKWLKVVYLTTAIPFALFAVLIVLTQNDKINLLGSLTLIFGLTGIGITLITTLILLISGKFGVNKKNWGVFLLTSVFCIIAGFVNGAINQMNTSVAVTTTQPARVESAAVSALKMEQQVASTPAEEKPKTSITKTEFDKLESGMTYEQVTEILGTPGEVKSEVGFKGDKFHQIIYGYKGEGSGSSFAQLTFQANKLNSKMQVGLK
ncbi:MULTISPECIES: DUF3862 domain-containing protein [unclassified Paenibacillus]|uniref:DUF3862 domain-containing protein n=1 Tax=unclassified Paenibacillus TaxID=185978 RepID=UPI003645A2C4